MDDFYRIYDEILLPGSKMLATIIDVNGSAYKKEGSMMLFREDGTSIGMISAGCLENNLAARIPELLEKQCENLVEFDMSSEDDLSWGQGAGCNGIIKIILEPISEKRKKDIVKVKKLLDQNKPVLEYKKLDKSGEYLFVPKIGSPFGRWTGAIPTSPDFSAKSGILSGTSVFQHTYLPKPRLILFGAGPDARPLVSLAAEVGFSVLVCDWRPSLCKRDHFPSAQSILTGSTRDLILKLALTENDFVIVMTHDFQKDQEILSQLNYCKVKYIGVLGPRERTKRLLQQNFIPDWIDAPMGAAIGAKGPYEIAVSVLARLIEIWRKPQRDLVNLLWTIPD